MKLKFPKPPPGYQSYKRPQQNSTFYRLLGSRNSGSVASNPGRVVMNPFLFLWFHPSHLVWVLAGPCIFLAIMLTLLLNTLSKPASGPQPVSTTATFPEIQNPHDHQPEIHSRVDNYRPNSRHRNRQLADEMRQAIAPPARETAPQVDAAPNPIQFSSNGRELTPESKQRLGNIAALICICLAALLSPILYLRLWYGYFLTGDANPGVVVATNPTLIAVTENLANSETFGPAIKVIKTRLTSTLGQPLEVGSVVGTISRYTYSPKLGFTDIHPFPVDEATHDKLAIASVLGTFDDAYYRSLLSALKQWPGPMKPGLYFLNEKA